MYQVWFRWMVAGLMVLATVLLALSFVAAKEVGPVIAGLNSTGRQLKADSPKMGPYIAWGFRIAGTLAFLAGMAILFGRRCFYALGACIAALFTEADGSAPTAAGPDRQESVKRRQWLGAICIAGLVAYTLVPFILNGYFRYDDFAIFNENRYHSLWALIFIPHGDHTYGLFRIELALMVRLAGYNAYIYNLVIAAFFAATILASVKVLGRLGVGPVGRWLCVAFCAGWTNWSEFLAGYFVLCTNLQIVLFYLLAVNFYLEADKSGALRHRIFVLLFTASAVFVDLGGLWVPFGVAVFAVCNELSTDVDKSWRDRAKKNTWLLGGLLALITAALCYNWYVFTRVTPGGFLSMRNFCLSEGRAAPWDIANIIGQTLYAVFGGLCLSTIMPVGYSRLPGPIVAAMVSGVAAVVTGVAWIWWRRMPKAMRWHACALVVVIFGQCAFVSIGRYEPGLNHLWPAKYVGPAYVLWCMLIGIIGEAVWREKKGAARPIVALSLVGAILAYFCVQGLSSEIVAKVSDFTRGAASELRNAKERKRDLNELKSKLIEPLAGERQAMVKLPVLGGEGMNQIYPSLFTYGLSWYSDVISSPGKQVVYLRNSAMKPEAEGELECKSLRDELGRRFVNALQHDEYVRRLYLSPTELVGITERGGSVAGERGIVRVTDGLLMPHGNDGAITVGSEGRAVLHVRDGKWDPERLHFLRIGLQYLGPEETAKTWLSFDSDFSLTGREYWIKANAGKILYLRVDLLQAAAYALSGEVGNVTLKLAAPGEYRIFYAVMD